MVQNFTKPLSRPPFSIILVKVERGYSHGNRKNISDIAIVNKIFIQKANFPDIQCTCCTKSFYNIMDPETARF